MRRGRRRCGRFFLTQSESGCATIIQFSLNPFFMVQEARKSSTALWLVSFGACALVCVLRGLREPRNFKDRFMVWNFCVKRWTPIQIWVIFESGRGRWWYWRWYSNWTSDLITYLPVIGSESRSWSVLETTRWTVSRDTFSSVDPVSH